MLRRLARFSLGHRRLVAAAWVVLFVAGIVWILSLANLVLRRYDDALRDSEEALRQKEKHGGEVVVVSAGPQRVTQVLRENGAVEVRRER